MLTDDENVLFLEYYIPIKMQTHLLQSSKIYISIKNMFKQLYKSLYLFQIQYKRM